MGHRLFNLFTTIWVGSLLTTGYIVAPTLFSLLSRTEAGDVAASLFRTQGFLSIVCGLVLLVIANRAIRLAAGGQGVQTLRRARRLVVAMIVCTLLGYFALQPWMNSLRLAAQAAGTDVGHSAFATRFGILHGVSSVFYLIESLLGVWLVCLRRVPDTFAIPG
ncbi:DUF4149 domain-containing protein [Pararobbsia alpina]|uniref:TMEM205-like domain-containing protein n=1 Tax=Pararobbsia alpina TaxID=621374 RepID=A0A6S7B6B7_9BURK|nr:DUF4149 domain-containing protein [Pararobbsia alpina]CAB3787194.1 hypothetical protein LMG28138_02387 [Pararobbsia alpina]